MGTYTIYQPMPDRPTNPPEQEYYITRRILIDVGMTCTMCGNPTRNDGEQCDRCMRAIAKTKATND
jgi:predicted amidophosphoribosyltransferase